MVIAFSAKMNIPQRTFNAKKYVFKYNFDVFFFYISDIFSDGFKFGTGKKVLSAVIKQKKEECAENVI